MINYLISNAATAAHVAGYLAIISMVALFIMFSGVTFFGPINDATSAFQFLFLIPVALAWHKIIGSEFSMLNTIVMVMGILAMLAFAISQILLVIRIVRFDQTLNLVLALSMIVALWMILSSLMSISTTPLTPAIIWTGVITGISMIMVSVGYWWLGGPKHPITAVSFLLSAVGMPLWAFWIAKWLKF